ncbi:MAG: DUF1998 domain-containing protein, partial [Planctomycetota bacterium]|nr:DUF1998 domain-containing protein [Planctomycetota bacterium]
GQGREPVRFARYTGQDDQERRDEIAADPPDILLTNYVMLELLLTRALSSDQRVTAAAEDLKFLVLDELHTYRGRQGADVALLVRRTREACRAKEMLCIGTSATMATGGTYADQRNAIADVATRLFGTVVRSENVIGETLWRSTPEIDFSDPDDKAVLSGELSDDFPIPTRHAEFIQTRMGSWLENTFGPTRDNPSDRLKRADPVTLTGNNAAAGALNQLTNAGEAQCAAAVRRWLLAGYMCEADPDTRARPFAFRLHQFISRGDAVYCSLEEAADRHQTLQGQQYVPGSREKLLFPLAFCRECGADYYTVWRTVDHATEKTVFKTRDLNERGSDGDAGLPGFLYRDAANPWPEDPQLELERLPDEWLEEARGTRRVRANMREAVPRPINVRPDGVVDDRGLEFTWTPAPFRFCQCCAVSYRARRGQSDFGRISTLASGGRSTATTILSLYAVQFLRSEETLEQHARKLLSFTDNRQDASLQAGHFNDFVEVSLMRAAVYKAAKAAGAAGIPHDELAQRVFQSLDLPIAYYAREPEVSFVMKSRTEQAFRNLLAYRMYRDLRRGWRLTSPNLEQCGLLRIDYVSLPDLCAASEYWQTCHPALATATPVTRERIARTLLDFMRRELAIDVDYLRRDFFERLQQQSSQHLRSPWAIDEDERYEETSAVFPRPRRPHDSRYFTYMSGRSGFGLFIGRNGTLPEYSERLTLADKEAICRDLMMVLAREQYLIEAVKPDDDGVPGYQLSASCMQWYSGDGTQACHDPIRVPNPPQEGGRTNPFFVDFYQRIASECQGLEAREHTAQVPYDQREERETEFAAARLPVLYCSPTMELGVDIAQLNVVNMRNVPPTPANYAQRSGRAGRSGQPAFVFTYCTAGSSHDQYFFRRQEQMVSGAVAPPRLDLANEDLIKAHIQAIWLAETQTSLGNSLTEILDVEGESPPLTLRPSIRSGLSKPGSVEAAARKAEAVLQTIGEELTSARWFGPDWLRQTLQATLQEFDAACERWRDLFRAAKKQQEFQHSIIRDQSRRHLHKEAERLRREAERQIDLLTDAKSVSQSDFYSYRYFASEGFLPGYNFPRLPLSAYIPARRRLRGQDEFLSRPRFLAISEFGPRSIIYHEGSRYIVNKVILPVASADDTGLEAANPVTDTAKQCQQCGYMHDLRADESGPDCCQNCESRSLDRIDSLLRLQNVATKRRDRITSDEEERTRMGYEIRTGLRFQERGGVKLVSSAEIKDGDAVDFNVLYGDAATIWRINLGWRRRADRERRGFVIDMENGNWANNDQLPDNEDPADPMGNRKERVVPYVVDRRNCLLLEPTDRLGEREMASLQAALKQAIQAVYQLEDNELAAEPLPTPFERRQILFFESAEGGAGVLRRLLDDRDAIQRVATEALRICHFDPQTGEDLRRSQQGQEDCEAACYACLMNYGNQRDHELLDRKKIGDILLKLAGCSMASSHTVNTFNEHLEFLKKQCDSRLEQSWLEYLVARGCHLPTTAQKYYPQCRTRPDFSYDGHVAIYIDGPPHDFPERQKRDAQQTAAMEDLGITVLRFHHEADWSATIDSHPNIFGHPTDSSAATEQADDSESELDLDLFPSDGHAAVKAVAESTGWDVDAGADVTDARGRVVGSFVLEISIGQSVILVVDGR